MLIRPALIALVLCGAVGLAGCAPAPAGVAGDQEPARVEAIEGSNLHLVSLTARAAERLGIETEPVVTDAGRLVVPYGALLYDAEGNAWAYVEHESLHYVRHALSVEVIDGNRVVLADGPPPGTVVVSVGAAELYGTEFEVGH